MLGVGGGNAKIEQKALREIDRETALFIAEARRLCDEYNKCVLDKDTYATRSENLRRRMAKVPELRDEVKNAKSDDDRRAALAKAYRAIVPDEARSDFKLDFSVLAQKPGAGAMAPLAPASALPTGAITVLFPDARIPVKNPLTPPAAPQGVCVRPRGLSLDEGTTGAKGAEPRASVSATTEAGDSVIATVFRFEHVKAP